VGDREQGGGGENLQGESKDNSRRKSEKKTKNQPVIRLRMSIIGLLIETNTSKRPSAAVNGQWDKTGTRTIFNNPISLWLG